jgi:magnesium-protoporphyrin O-methyltransferase
MSSCCSSFCTGAQQMFNAKVAEGDLRRYRRSGPNKTTRFLRDGIVAAGGGESVIDIGGGIGALSAELLARGFARGTLVDASPAYLNVARRAAAERGLAERLEFREGDFLDHAPQLAPADAVVLDRVVCCYPAYRPLLEAAARHSQRLFAYAYPRDRWYIRFVIGIENLIQAAMRRSFRAFVHAEPAMSAVLAAQGFRRVSRRTTFVWCADVYARDGAPSATD